MGPAQPPLAYHVGGHEPLVRYLRLEGGPEFGLGQVDGERVEALEISILRLLLLAEVFANSTEFVRDAPARASARVQPIDGQKAAGESGEQDQAVDRHR